MAIEMYRALYNQLIFFTKLKGEREIILFSFMYDLGFLNIIIKNASLLLELYS